MVNLGLQSVGLMRKEMPSAAEKALKNKNSLKELRLAGNQFRTDIAASIQPVVDLLSDIMQRLELKGKRYMMLPHRTTWRIFGKFSSW